MMRSLDIKIEQMLSYLVLKLIKIDIRVMFHVTWQKRALE